MSYIKDDFQLLLALNSIHVDQISNSIINELIALDEEDFLIAGEDAGLKNVWEEICAQVQGEDSIHWDVYEETLRDFILKEFNSQTEAIQILISYIGSFDDSFRHDKEEDEFSIVEEYSINEIMNNLMMKAGSYESESISRYLDNDFDEEEDYDEEE